MCIIIILYCIINPTYLLPLYSPTFSPLLIQSTFPSPDCPTSLPPSCRTLHSLINLFSHLSSLCNPLYLRSCHPSLIILQSPSILSCSSSPPSLSSSTILHQLFSLPVTTPSLCYFPPCCSSLSLSFLALKHV